MFTRFAIIVFACLLFACSQQKGGEPHVVIETKFGEIELEIYQSKAPQSAAAFLANVEAGIYKSSSFYRILSENNQPTGVPKSELIQGGVWKSNYKLSREAKRVPHETTQQTGIQHKNGVISFARQEPGTAGTEFFICVGDQPGFDFNGENNPDKQGYAAFGRVVKGMDVVLKVYNQPEDEQQFDPPVHIFNIKKL